MIKNSNEMELELRRSDLDFRDLKKDFDYVVELNTELSRRYQEVFDTFPKTFELDIVITDIKKKMNSEDVPDNVAVFRKRLIKLQKFRSALVLIEKDDPTISAPMYEDE